MFEKTAFFAPLLAAALVASNASAAASFPTYETSGVETWGLDYDYDASDYDSSDTYEDSTGDAEEGSYTYIEVDENGNVFELQAEWGDGYYIEQWTKTTNLGGDTQLIESGSFEDVSA